MTHASEAVLAFDPMTLAFYDAKAPEYVASGKDVVSRWLVQFMEMLPLGARVLELGCGGGRDAEAMIARGFDVEPTDGSAAIAVKAAQRLGRPVRVLKFDELSDVEAYDAVWANASLLHVPREAMDTVLGQIFGSLKPGACTLRATRRAALPRATVLAGTSIIPIGLLWRRPIRALPAGKYCRLSNMRGVVTKAGNTPGLRLPRAAR